MRTLTSITIMALALLTQACGNQMSFQGNDNKIPKAQMPSDPGQPDPQTQTPVPGQHDRASECDMANIASAQIKISSMSIMGAQGITETLVPATPTQDLESLSKGFEISVSNDMQLVNISLILAADGNQVVMKDGKVFPLFTPSAQTSGLKLMPAENVRLRKATKYIVSFSFETQRDIHAAEGKCILQPVMIIQKVEKQ